MGLDQDSNDATLSKNGLLVTDFSKKAQLLNDHFILKFTTIDADSVIPKHNPLNSPLTDTIVFSEEKILNTDDHLIKIKHIMDGRKYL